MDTWHRADKVFSIINRIYYGCGLKVKHQDIWLKDQ